MKVKEESEKVGLKLNFQKTKIMAFGPISSWQINGETLEIMRNAGLDEAQARIKIVGRNINNLRYTDAPPLLQKVKKN